MSDIQPLPAGARPYWTGQQEGLVPQGFEDHLGIGFHCPVCGYERRDYGSAARSNIGRHIDRAHADLKEAG